ncbi:hypothetical protein V6N12_028550 [Hibiscus sabdariffa]|uniref:Uncharacterized protein n=1 Tax=Hibiscus sabdariffa TaxID=183260 RepID=A0ABR2F641_9ROSI
MNKSAFIYGKIPFWKTNGGQSTLLAKCKRPKRFKSRAFRYKELAPGWMPMHIPFGTCFSGGFRFKAIN